MSGALKMTQQSIRDALSNARGRLIDQLQPGGYWTGELSSSALATAVAVFALSRVDREKHRELIWRGLVWLALHANFDGGWGDSPDSKSNVSTTLLCWSALSLADRNDPLYPQILQRTEAWLTETIGSLQPEAVAAAVLKHYGDDRTFSAPILTMCALAGRLGEEPTAWNRVPQLPFELAAFPHQVFKWLRLPVVSYAIPALIAIGLVRHRHNPVSGALLNKLRDSVTDGVMLKLKNIQPTSGGFLEAAPLTSFVVMSLADCGFREHEVATKGAAFLAASMRPDGSWPIDSNLSTWVTTLSVKALADGSGGAESISEPQRRTIRNWLIAQQCRDEDPFTHAAPGGWAWTDLPGAVPDADDTAGALLALKKLGLNDARTINSARAGIGWLLDLQNADGGIPTFCRGWGKLPFDRSCPDLTAHAVCALDAWYDDVEQGLRSRIDRALEEAIDYLSRVQRADGAWVPLWFGNQASPEGRNPTYGTAQVVNGLAGITPGRLPSRDMLIEKGCDWLVSAQNGDGGWGGARGAASTVEETALAVKALGWQEDYRGQVERGLAWLVDRTNGGRDFPASPIGLYFASLWYSEKLYPLIFAVSALGAGED